VPKPIHILLADDHWEVRAGLHALLDSEANLRVVGEAATGKGEAGPFAALRAGSSLRARSARSAQDDSRWSLL